MNPSDVVTERLRESGGRERRKGIGKGLEGRIRGVYTNEARVMRQ